MQRRTLTLLLVVTAVLTVAMLLAACGQQAGPAGPAGPQGEPGSTGPQGPPGRQGHRENRVRQARRENRGWKGHRENRDRQAHRALRVQQARPVRLPQLLLRLALSTSVRPPAADAIRRSTKPS